MSQHPPSTPKAHVAIYAAASALERQIETLIAFRSGLAAVVLPVPAANDRLDHSDDMLAIVARQMADAARHMADAIDAIEAEAQASELQAAEIEYRLAHSANDNHAVPTPAAL